MFITQSDFFVPKDFGLNSRRYFITKINNKRELPNIAANHSADIDYKNFVKIYRECTKEPYLFLTIDPTLPVSDFLRFTKCSFLLVKMIVNHQLKIIDNKIKANQAQHDLNRLAAKISPLFSVELRKYDYRLVKT